MDTHEKVKLAIKNPVLMGRKLNELFANTIPKYDYKSNTSVFDKDWDNLIILDACRFDIAKQYDWEADSVKKHRSRATNTREFYTHEVSGRDLTDTVYVTENAWIKELSENGHDFNVHQIMVTENGPQKVYNEAESAYKKYDNKRIVIHFTQPHFPVLSDKYEKINDEWFCPDKPLNLWGNKHIDAHDHEITREELLEAYKDNLESVIPYVKKIASSFNGKTVVSADHGQLFNERVAPIPIREWGHPKGSYADGILDVPWIVYNPNQQRKIQSGEDGDIVDKSNTDTKQRLKELGYLQ